MPAIAYTARSLSGQMVEGHIRAKNSAEARNLLSQRGLEVISISSGEDAGPTSWNINLSFGSPINTTTLAMITGQISLMLRTGTAVVECLEAIQEQLTDERVLGVLEAVQQDLRGGATLGSALAQHPRVFDGFYVSAVRSGEMTGQLPEVFKRLEIHLQKRLEMRNNVVMALIYPTIISIMSLGAVVFIVTFVLPKFVDIFQRGNVALPLPTRMLMGLSQFIVGHWLFLLVLVFAIPAALFTYVRSPKGSLLLDRLLIRLPFVGPMLVMVQSSLLLRTLGTLLQSGVPLLDSLEVTRNAVKNSRFKAFVTDVTRGVTQGEDLASNFGRSELMTPAIKQMVATGERSGKLAFVMNLVADSLDDASEKRMKKLSVILEPMIIVVMGGIIGFIAVSVLLPLFRLTSAARGQ